MRLAVACAVLLCIVLVGPVWCAPEAPPAPQAAVGGYYAMLGYFFPTESDRSGSGALSAQYLGRTSGPYFGLQFTRSSHPGVASGAAVQLDDSATDAIIGMRRWRGQWYVGAGVGAAFVKREVGTPAGVTTDHDTNLAWEVVVGALLGRRGLAEVRYVDGGDDGARGFIGSLGVRF